MAVNAAILPARTKSPSTAWLPTNATPASWGAPGQQIGQNLYNIEQPQQQAMTNQTASLMKSQAQDAILRNASDSRRQLADQFAMMGMGRSGAFAGGLANLLSGTGRDAVAAGTNVDIEQAKQNADYSLNRANLVNQALAQRAGLGVQMRGQDNDWNLGNRQIDTTIRGQDINKELELGSQGLQKELGWGNINTTQRGQDINKELELGSQGLQRELGWGNINTTQRGQDINKELELGNQGIQSRGQDIQYALGQGQIGTTQRGQTMDWLLGQGSQALQGRGQDLQNSQFNQQLAQQNSQFGQTFGLQQAQQKDESTRWRQTLEVQKDQIQQDYQIRMQQLDIQRQQASSDSEYRNATLEMERLKMQFTQQMSYWTNMSTALDVFGKMGIDGSTVFAGMTGQSSSLTPSLVQSNNAAQEQLRKSVPGFRPTFTDEPAQLPVSQTLNPFLQLLQWRPQ